MLLKRWEKALICGFIAAICVWLPLSAMQRTLASKLTRLHIVANSDSSWDQWVKLRVRDNVLAAAKQWSDPPADLLEELKAVAEDTLAHYGVQQPVRVSREEMYFDTREYESFSLPAGEYDAIRIVLGDGQGKNWWCVLFPPLCAGVCEEDWKETAEEAGLSEDEIALVRQDGTGYVIRFKILELFGELGGLLSGDASK